LIDFKQTALFMECLYNPDFDENSSSIILSDEEHKHTKALRLKPGDEVLITNGKSISAKCRMIDFSKTQSEFKIIKIFENFNEKEIKLSVALGLLDTKDRFEFALEKCIELGIKEFIPLISDYSSKKRPNISRLETKAIAALKQSKRSSLPKIHEPIELNDLLKKNNSQIILCDENGNSDFNKTLNPLLLVGPEGGFSNQEISLIKSKNANLLSLGSSRLRAETALIAGTVKILL
jgi:16S rRNA (uracil1498-N3)-methyltransferase